MQHPKMGIKIVGWKQLQTVFEQHYTTIIFLFVVSTVECKVVVHLHPSVFVGHKWQSWFVHVFESVSILEVQG